MDLAQGHIAKENLANHSAYAGKDLADERAQMKVGFVLEV